MSQKAKSFVREIRKVVHCKYLLFLPDDYARFKVKRWPLILFLHGAGERGTNIALVKTHGIPKFLDQRPDFSFIVVSPQCPMDRFWENDMLSSLLDEIEEKYRVDRNREYVTGLSMGGFGTWALATEYPHRFAAIAPICGGGNPYLVPRIRHLPIWAFHGAKDRVVPIRLTRELVQALRKCGGNVRFTVYRNAEHDSWTRTYENPRLYEWFLEHQSK